MADLDAKALARLLGVEQDTAERLLELDAAGEDLHAKAEARRADPANEEARAAYREASERVAALRRTHREAEIAAGRRFAGPGVAAPAAVEASAEVPAVG